MASHPCQQGKLGRTCLRPQADPHVQPAQRRIAEVSDHRRPSRVRPITNEPHPSAATTAWASHCRYGTETSMSSLWASLPHCLAERGRDPDHDAAQVHCVRPLYSGSERARLLGVVGVTQDAWWPPTFTPVLGRPLLAASMIEVVARMCVARSRATPARRLRRPEQQEWRSMEVHAHEWAADSTHRAV
jgi:hypothetical protein